ncbi:hypothetical protein [Streptosporangium sp. NPDC001681]|uniref:hypothetical protein n=1 Tax=Streptosporangium sp. NPDC001681 TaxID=3154395 RepID=UPI0033270307
MARRPAHGAAGRRRRHGTFAEQAARSPQLGIFINTHNDYLRLAAETGIVPALLLLLLVYRAIRRATGTYEHVLASAVVLLFGNTLSNLMASVPFLGLPGNAARGSASRNGLRDDSPNIAARGARHMTGAR